jgi:hypothetical protein
MWTRLCAIVTEARHGAPAKTGGKASWTGGARCMNGLHGDNGREMQKAAEKLRVNL